MPPSRSNNPSISTLSENCLLIQFDNVMSEEVHRKVMELCKSFSESPLPFLNDIVPSYSSIALLFDSLNYPTSLISHEDLIESVRERCQSLGKRSQKKETERLIKVRVRFGGAFGKDLREMAKTKGITEPKFIDLFCEEIYKVFMIGFRPGFPYMGTVPGQLSAERLPTPRAVVPAGSVGIAGRQTGIYPMDSPGGWRIIGRTDLNLLDIGNGDNPTYFHPGDSVKFEAI